MQWVAMNSFVAPKVAIRIGSGIEAMSFRSHSSNALSGSCPSSLGKKMNQWSNIEFAENQNTEPEEKIWSEKYQEETIISILA